MLCYSRRDVAAHNTKTDCWIIINNKVCDVSGFIHEHPGGPRPLTKRAGEDGTEGFERIGHSAHALEWLAQLCIGELASEQNVDLEANTASADQPVVDVLTPRVFEPTHQPSTENAPSLVIVDLTRSPTIAEMQIPSKPPEMIEKRNKNTTEEREPQSPSKSTRKKRKTAGGFQLSSTAGLMKVLFSAVVLVMLYRVLGI